MEAVATIREETHQPVTTEKADDLPPGFLLVLNMSSIRSVTT